MEDRSMDESSADGVVGVLPPPGEDTCPLMSDSGTNEPEARASSAGAASDSPGDPASDEVSAFPADANHRKLQELPREVGVMLVTVGALGWVLPGMAGTPALVAGGLILWPNMFGKLERWAQRRYPSAYNKGMKQVGRYLDDFERRFPDATQG